MEELKKSVLQKTSKVDVQTKKGGTYSYRYTELADINEYIDSIGEKYYQVINKVDGDDYIFTKRIGENAPKELLQGCKLLIAPVSSEYSNPAQEQGSALTYARRYSLLMAYGLATEDDNASSLNVPKVETKEDAEKYVLNFGKHKGKTLKELVKTDDDYLDWLLNGEKTDKLLKDAITLLINRFDEDTTDFENQMNEDNEMINEGQIQYIKSCLSETSLKSTLKKLNVDKIEDLTWVQANEIYRIISKKLEEKNKNDEEAF